MAIDAVAEGEVEEDIFSDFKIILSGHAESYRLFDIESKRKERDAYVYDLIRRVAGSNGQEQVQKLIGYYESAKKKP